MAWFRTCSPINCGTEIGRAHAFRRETDSSSHRYHLLTNICVCWKKILLLRKPIYPGMREMEKEREKARESGAEVPWDLRRKKTECFFAGIKKIPDFFLSSPFMLLGSSGILCDDGSGVVTLHIIQYIFLDAYRSKASFLIPCHDVAGWLALSCIHIADFVLYSNVGRF